jgi:hypothetical protein
MADMTAAELADHFEGLLPALERNLSMAARMAAEMAAAEARKTTRFKDRSAVLRNSIGFDGPDGTFAAGDLGVTVAAGASYASFVEKGTKAHVIKPKHRTTLRWPVQGGFRFARIVNHPGTAPTHFLQDAADGAQEKLGESLVPDAIELSFVQVGFSPG